MAQVQWGKFMIMFTVITGSGYGIMKWATPTDEQFYNALSPELKAKVDAAKRDRLARESITETLNAAGKEDKIVWADDFASTPPKGGARRPS